MSKKVTIIVILIVIIIALYFAMKKPTQNSTPAPSQTAAVQENSATSATQTAAVVNAIPVDPAISQIKSSGLSDKSLNQDISAIDAQLKDFSSENSVATK